MLFRSIPLSFSENVAELLGTDVHVIQGAGHFTEGDGWTQAPGLVTQVDTLIAGPESPQEEAYSALNQELQASGVDVSLLPSEPKKQLEDASYTPKTHNDPMQTMYEDMAETINTANAKYMADMLHEEREREVIIRANRRRLKTKVVMGIVGLALVVAGIVLIRRGIDFEPPAVEIQEQTRVPSLVAADAEAQFDTDGITSVFVANEHVTKVLGNFTIPSRQIGRAHV